MNFFTEWNNACAYAGECLPPFVYEWDGDLISVMSTIAIGCTLAYYFTGNKRRA